MRNIHILLIVIKCGYFKVLASDSTAAEASGDTDDETYTVLPEVDTDNTVIISESFNPLSSGNQFSLVTSNPDVVELAKIHVEDLDRQSADLAKSFGEVDALLAEATKLVDLDGQQDNSQNTAPWIDVSTQKTLDEIKNMEYGVVAESEQLTTNTQPNHPILMTDRFKEDISKILDKKSHGYQLTQQESFLLDQFDQLVQALNQAIGANEQTGKITFEMLLNILNTKISSDNDDTVNLKDLFGLLELDLSTIGKKLIKEKILSGDLPPPSQKWVDPNTISIYDFLAGRKTHRPNPYIHLSSKFRGDPRAQTNNDQGVDFEGFTPDYGRNRRLGRSFYGNIYDANGFNTENIKVNLDHISDSLNSWPEGTNPSQPEKVSSQPENSFPESWQPENFQPETLQPEDFQTESSQPENFQLVAPESQISGSNSVNPEPESSEPSKFQVITDPDQIPFDLDHLGDKMIIESDGETFTIAHSSGKLSQGEDIGLNIWDDQPDNIVATSYCDGNLKMIVDLENTLGKCLFFLDGFTAGKCDINSPGITLTGNATANARLVIDLTTCHPDYQVNGQNSVDIYNRPLTVKWQIYEWHGDEINFDRYRQFILPTHCQYANDYILQKVYSAENTTSVAVVGHQTKNIQENIAFKFNIYSDDSYKTNSLCPNGSMYPNRPYWVEMHFVLKIENTQN